MKFYTLLWGIIALQYTSINAQITPQWKFSVGAETVKLKNEDFTLPSVPNLLKVEKIDEYGVEFSLSTSFYQSSIKEKNTDIFFFNYAMKVHPLKFQYGKKYQWDPYLLTGFGLTKYEINTDNYWNIGAGLNFWFNNKYGLQYQANFNHNFTLNDYNSMSHSFGVFLNLDKKPTDTDKDGILDYLDKCPRKEGVKELEGCPKPKPKKQLQRKQPLPVYRPKPKTIIKDTLPKKPKAEKITVKKRVLYTEIPIINSIDTKNIIKISTIYFELDEYDILEEERSKIHLIIYMLERYPHAKILLEAHASPEGDVDYNLTLAQNRAETVLNALIDLGVPQHIISIKNFGGTKPVKSINKEMSYILNRRVNIILYK
jgi:outer membrane protein OmpA-like peptidoglycan-associated protein